MFSFREKYCKLDVIPRNEIKKWSEVNMLIILGIFMVVGTFTEYMCLCHNLSAINNTINGDSGAFADQDTLSNSFTTGTATMCIVYFV